MHVQSQCEDDRLPDAPHCYAGDQSVGFARPSAHNSGLLKHCGDVFWLRSGGLLQACAANLLQV